MAEEILCFATKWDINLTHDEKALIRIIKNWINTNLKL